MINWFLFIFAEPTSLLNNYSTTLVILFSEKNGFVLDIDNSRNRMKNTFVRVFLWISVQNSKLVEVYSSNSPLYYLRHYSQFDNNCVSFSADGWLRTKKWFSFKFTTRKFERIISSRWSFNGYEFDEWKSFSS